MGRQERPGSATHDWKDSPFSIEAKLVFGWLPKSFVSTVEWDANTADYTTCSPNCTFLLQRSDTTVLNTSVSAVILLQASHGSSGGSTDSPYYSPQYSGENRYFVMEYRHDVLLNLPMLLIHWGDIDPSGKDPWCDGTPGGQVYCQRPRTPLGHSFLTDCNPDTVTWDDAGCFLGQSVLLDTGSVGQSVKMLVTVSQALESGQLRVTISRSARSMSPSRVHQPPAFDPNDDLYLDIGLTVLLIPVCAAGACCCWCLYRRCNRKRPRTPVAPAQEEGQGVQLDERSTLLPNANQPDSVMKTA